MKAETLDELTPTEFIRLVLKRVVQVVDPERHEVWISGPNTPLYIIFYEMRERYGSFFPALEKMHFYWDGPFPESEEIAEAMQIMLFVGGITTGFSEGQSVRGIRWFDDTDAVTSAELDLLFADKEDLRMYFDDIVQSVAKTDGFIVPSPLTGKMPQGMEIPQ